MGLTSTVWGTLLGNPLLGLQTGGCLAVVGALGHVGYDASLSWYESVSEERFVLKYGLASDAARATAAKAQEELESQPTYELIARGDEMWPHDIFPMFRISDQEIENLIQTEVENINNRKQT